VGVLARTSAEANSLSFVITIVLAGAGPVIIPPGRLPPWLIQLSALNPATYAASALRQSVIGPVTPRLGLDLTVLAAFSVLTLWVVNRKLDWRQ
jgi:ABC-2 type transport system permease protein